MLDINLEGCLTKAIRAKHLDLILFCRLICSYWTVRSFKYTKCASYRCYIYLFLNCESNKYLHVGFRTIAHELINMNKYEHIGQTFKINYLLITGKQLYNLFDHMNESNKIYIIPKLRSPFKQIILAISLKTH